MLGLWKSLNGFLMDISITRGTAACSILLGIMLFTLLKSCGKLNPMMVGPLGFSFVTIGPSWDCCGGDIFMGLGDISVIVCGIIGMF